MKKRIAWILMVAILMGMMSGCISSGSDGNDSTPIGNSSTPTTSEPTKPTEPIYDGPLYADTLTDKKRGEIFEAWNREMGKHPDNPVTGNTVIEGVLYYYGTYNGYDVLFADSILFSIWMERVADEYFFHTEYGMIWLHRNGEFIKLRKAYQNGLISKEDVATVAQKHYDFEVERSDAEKVHSSYLHYFGEDKYYRGSSETEPTSE